MSYALKLKCTILNNLAAKDTITTETENFRIDREGRPIKRAAYSLELPLRHL